jgi:hypothetical protein
MMPSHLLERVLYLIYLICTVVVLGYRESKPRPSKSTLIFLGFHFTNTRQHPVHLHVSLHIFKSDIPEI